MDNLLEKPYINKILCTFDAVIDTYVGFIYYLQKYCYTSQFINQYYLNRSDKQIRRDRVIIGKSFIENAFIEEYKSSSIDIYNEIVSKPDEYIKLLELSKPTSIVNLINAYNIYGDDIKTSIICNKIEADFLRNNYFQINDSIIYVTNMKLEDIDIIPYSRIILGTGLDGLRIKNPDAKNFIILNYRENYDKEYYFVLCPELVIMIGDLNTCTSVSAFKDIKSKMEEDLSWQQKI